MQFEVRSPHIYFAYTTAQQAIDTRLGIRFVQSPKVGKTVDQSVRNNRQGRTLRRIGHGGHQPVERTVERSITAHHHNQAIAVGRHHRRQALDATGAFALHEIVRLLCRLQTRLNARPASARTAATFLRTIENSPT